MRWYEILASRRRRRVAADVEPEEPTEPAVPEPATSDAEDEPVVRPVQQNDGPPDFAPKSKPKHVDAAPQPPAAPSTLDAEQIAGLCTASDVPELTAVIVRAGITDAAQIRERIEGAAEIKSMFARAAKTNELIDPAIADTLIADDMPVATARTVLNHMLVVAQSPEICGLRSVDGSSDHGWGRAMAAAAKKDV